MPQFITPEMQTQAIDERIDYIDKLLEKLYYEHVEQFTYMMETPYNYHYWCEQCQPVLYNQREELLDCLIELRNLK